HPNPDPAPPAPPPVRQRQAHAPPPIRTPTARSPPTPPHAPAEEILERAEPAEIPHEDFERVREVEPTEPRAGPDATLHPGVAVTVVRRPLLRVAQDLVRFRRLPELLRRLRRAVVPVWVVLERQLPVRLLDGLLVSVPRYAQDLVIVPHPLVLDRACRALEYVRRTPAASRPQISTPIDPLRMPRQRRQLRHQRARVLHDRRHRLVRHPRRTDHSDHAGQRRPEARRVGNERGG